MKYPFVSRSGSDINGNMGGLGFVSRETAQEHADAMNRLVSTYDGDSSNDGWNKSFWPEKPLPWEVHEVKLTEEELIEFNKFKKAWHL
jgi:hypothetical protein